MVKQKMPARAREIVREVCARRKVCMREVMGPTRGTKSVIAARHQIWWILRYVANRHAPGANVYSLAYIGRLFGRHHSTVLHGIRKVNASLARGEIECPFS